MLLLIGFSFLAGVFTVLSPCILPVLPVILGASTLKGKWRPLGIVLGLVLSFTFFTLSLTAIVRATGISSDFLRNTAILLIALFGIIMIVPSLSHWFSQLVSKFAEAGSGLQNKAKSDGFFSGLLFGMALGLIWTPCAGPILGAITALVATQSVNSSAIMLTLSYAIGSAIPLLLIIYGGKKVLNSSKFLSRHSERIRSFFGFLMILTALALAYNWDMVLQTKLDSSYFSPSAFEDNEAVRNELDKLRGVTSYQSTKKLVDLGPAPSIHGATSWLNTNPLTLEQLKGKVVLIDFWTYSCINCLRTLPYITEWDKKYRDKGLVIIGVHTPEFEFEKVEANVKEAAERLGIKYPIALDNDYAIWKAYKNRYWPAHYLIDKDGEIRMVHFGEGGYVETENGIRKLLGLTELSMKEPVKSNRKLTPETYLGLSRASAYTQMSLASDGKTIEYSQELKNDEAGLKGEWRIEPESITSLSNDSQLNLNFLAKNVYLVMTGESTEPVKIFVDGKFHREFLIDAPRKYDIADVPYGRHQLSLHIPKGISAYAFTFGDD